MRNFIEASQGRELITSERRKLIKSQASVIRKTIKDLGIMGTCVSSDPEFRQASFFEKSKTIGISSTADIPVVLSISAENKKIDDLASSSSVLLVSPHTQGSGFIADENDNLFTDSFWVCEDGRFKHIVPSEPVRIDIMSSILSEYRSDSAFSKYADQQKRLHSITDNKHHVREILTKEGILVPEGILVNPEDDIRDKIRSFVNEHQKASGFVLKGLNGAHGDNVVMFGKNRSQLLYLEGLAWDYVDAGQPFLLEKRIIPPNIPNIQKDNDKRLDYNFRILVNLDRENPKAVDGEIRFKILNTNPVNITSETEPALAAKLNVLNDQELVDRLFHTAEISTEALMKEAFSSNDQFAGFAGVDLIIDKNGKIYVMEINAGTLVGGLSTLATLNEGPVGSVKEVLIPEWIRQFELDSQERRSPQMLRRIPYDEIDVGEILHSYIELKDNTSAGEFLLQNGYVFQDQVKVLDYLLRHAIQSENFEIVDRYLLSLLEKSPDDRDLRIQKARLERAKSGDESKIFVLFEKEFVFAKDKDLTFVAEQIFPELWMADIQEHQVK